MQSDSAGPAAPRRWWAVADWPLWQLPARGAACVIFVEITALALVIALAMSRSAPSSVVLMGGALLIAVGIVHTEIAVGVERTRLRIGDGNHVDLSSVWTFAGAVLLPPTVAAAVIIALEAHRRLRVDRLRVPLYRSLFSAATIVLASLAASAVMAGGMPTGDVAPEPALVPLVLAIFVYTTVNTCLVAATIAMSSSPRDLATVFGDWDDIVLELATLSMGALTAVAIVINPWLVGLVLPPLLLLHRAVLVRRLEHTSITDGKTGLLNAGAWHAQAERALERSARSVRSRAVLVLDLDHFKAVNDTHGHLVGDHVLAAVADALRSEAADRDLVGRFGGEEFVVLLAGVDGGGDQDLEAVAERLRRRIATLRVEIPTPDGPLTVAGLSVSVGGAICPASGADLSALLQVADTALYAAKQAGRNAVRMRAVPPTGTSPASTSDTVSSDSRSRTQTLTPKSRAIPASPDA